MKVFNDQMTKNIKLVIKIFDDQIESLKNHPKEIRHIFSQLQNLNR